MIADTWDTADIARNLGLSRAYVTDKLTKKEDFPRPMVNLSRRTRRWRRVDVLRHAGVPEDAIQENNNG